MNDLYIYTGLTDAQFEDLARVVEGDVDLLFSIPGARLRAMAEMIIDEPGYGLVATEFGVEVYQRGLAAMRGDMPEAVISLDMSGRDAARALRKIGHKWVKSAHAKVLLTLGARPGQAWDVLLQAYGWRTIQEMLERGLIRGETRKGHWFWLEPGGTNMLMEAAGQLRMLTDE